MTDSRRLADDSAPEGQSEATTTTTSAINPYDLAMVVLKRKHWVVRAVLGVMILTALVVLLIPNTYRSACTILPSGKTDKMADLKSLAGLAGFTQQDETSSELYPSIISSNTIVDAVLDETYQRANLGSLTAKQGRFHRTTPRKWVFDQPSYGSDAWFHPKSADVPEAAIGVTEETDAVCVVVSEETGTISVTRDGRRRLSGLTTISGTS